MRDERVMLELKPDWLVAISLPVFRSRPRTSPYLPVRSVESKPLNVYAWIYCQRR